MQFASSGPPPPKCGVLAELHHDKKKDVPSGQLSNSWVDGLTESLLQQGAAMRKNSRCRCMWSNLNHSVRLPCFVAHREVIFGNQRLTCVMTPMIAAPSWQNLGTRSWNVMSLSMDRTLTMNNKTLSGASEGFYHSIRKIKRSRRPFVVGPLDALTAPSMMWISRRQYPIQTKPQFFSTDSWYIEHGTVFGRWRWRVRSNHIQNGRSMQIICRPFKLLFVRCEATLKHVISQSMLSCLDETGEIKIYLMVYKIRKSSSTCSWCSYEWCLRIMQGFRFQASLGFELEQETL